MDKTKELEQLFTQKYKNTASVIVQQHGKKVYEHNMNYCDANNPVHVFSITKSILSILIGIAIDHGYINGIDTPILDFFPHYKVKKNEKTIQKITLRHMLTMTAPYKYLIGPYAKFFSSDDWVSYSLDLLGGRGKIGKFRYAPLIGPDIFSAIITNTTEHSVLEFANQYLFGPLGIHVPGSIYFKTKEEQMEFYQSKNVSGWVTGPTGVHTGGWGLTLSSEDMLKIGQLLLHHGTWNGQQIVSESWVKESTSPKSQWKKNLKYGYLWWIIDEKTQSFAAMGDGGNVIYVNRDADLVIVMTGYFEKHTADRIDLIKQHIEPLWYKG